MLNILHHTCPPSVWRKAHKEHKGRQQPSEPLRLCRCPREAVLRFLRALCGESRFVAAFTLVEMLTVIAIIGILAAILIPTIQAAIRRARMTAASADIRTLMTALTQYSMDFGAFPPDQRPVNINDTVPPNLDPFPASLNPNQCMLWYLTRTYSNGDFTQAGGQPLGYPIQYNPLILGIGKWAPNTTGTVFARGNYGPYFSPNGKQTKDIAGDGYPEFVDPWGRPYMYRAYTPQASSWASATVNAVTGPINGQYTVTLALTNGSGMYNPFGGGYFSIGSIQLAGALNGTYAFQGALDTADNLDNWITFATTIAPSGSACTYCFPLHNPQSCDLYSLGPNGRTRADLAPANPPSISYANTITGEWHPVDAPSLAQWVLFWGTPGDGNDTATGNLLTNTKDQDDVNNW